MIFCLSFLMKEFISVFLPQHKEERGGKLMEKREESNGQIHVTIEEVFNTYFNQIYQLALQTCKSPDMAEDLTQEIFIKYWECSRNGQILFAERLLYTIAKRTVIDHLRKNINRDLVLSLTEECLKYDAQPDTSEEEKEQKIITERKLFFIAEIAKQMPPKRLQIFKLRWEEGLSIKEIAENLHLSLSTVNIQLKKAMDFLKSNAQLSTSEILLMCILLASPK